MQFAPPEHSDIVAQRPVQMRSDVADPGIAWHSESPGHSALGGPQGHAQSPFESAAFAFLQRVGGRHSESLEHAARPSNASSSTSTQIMVGSSPGASTHFEGSAQSAAPAQVAKHEPAVQIPVRPETMGQSLLVAQLFVQIPVSARTMDGAFAQVPESQSALSKQRE